MSSVSRTVLRSQHRKSGEAALALGLEQDEVAVMIGHVCVSRDGDLVILSCQDKS